VHLLRKQGLSGKHRLTPQSVQLEHLPWISVG
jgi:hypothetical protein